ncbi:MAG: type II secretion system F family protein [Rhodospirillaceae bacterium]|nr:type II secretion system F family protein [Rhodospirillaceae bacterium]
MLAYLPFRVESGDFMAVMVGAVTLFVLYAVWSSFLVRDPMTRRVRQLFDHRRNLKTSLSTPGGHAARKAVSAGGAAGLARRVVKLLNLARSRQAEKITLDLSRAGMRGADALNVYLFAKLALPFVFGGAAAFVLFATPILPAPVGVKALIACVVVLAGAYLPEVLIANKAQKRRQGLQKGLPDSLDLLVICAEAGLGLEAALMRVAGEMANASPEVADEFGLAAVELGFLPDRKMALTNLDRRADLPGVRAVVNTLMQTEKYGTPLAQSLRVLSAEFRNERMMKAEEKAAKLPATLTVPLVAFILPTLFVVLLGPAVLRAIDGLGSL